MFLQSAIPSITVAWQACPFRPIPIWWSNIKSNGPSLPANRVSFISCSSFRRVCKSDPYEYWSKDEFEMNYRKHIWIRSNKGNWMSLFYRHCDTLNKFDLLSSMVNSSLTYASELKDKDEEDELITMISIRCRTSIGKAAFALDCRLKATGVRSAIEMWVTMWIDCIPNVMQTA
jgi:hypothetical protein